MNNVQIQAVVVLDIARQLVLERPVLDPQHGCTDARGFRVMDYSSPEAHRPGCLYCAVGAVCVACEKMGHRWTEFRAVHEAFEAAVHATEFNRYSIHDIRSPDRINALFDKAIELLGGTVPSRSVVEAVTS